jgi:hypothetical protein
MMASESTIARVMKWIYDDEQGQKALDSVPEGRRFIQTQYTAPAQRGYGTQADWVAIPSSSTKLEWLSTVSGDAQVRDLAYTEANALVWDRETETWREPKWRRAPSGKMYHIDDVRYMSRRDREENGIV